MNKNFPLSFQAHIKSPNIKAAFFSEVKPAHPRDCKNCGGIGTLILFVATGGPFVNVPSGKDLVAHWYDGRWWAGKNIEDACPVCHGTGIDPAYVEQPARVRAMEYAEVVK